MIKSVTTKLGFIRAALAVGVAIPILAGSGAFAQEPSPAALSPAVPLNAPGATGAAPQPGSEPPTHATGATAETERIIVTGSNIPTAQEVGPNPVLNINRDLINKSGQRTAEELIKTLPVANGGGVPVSNNATGFTPGASAISLRGLGPEATLVLINGRRLSPYPVGAGGTTSFFDLRSIPEAAIESIEILKDGASTTYGADAIAGVVNIKLRESYNGAEVSVGYGNTTDKDSGEYRASVVFGVGDGNTQITGVMDFYHRNSIFNRDRGYSAVPPFLSTNSTPENLQLSFAAVSEAGGGAAATAAGFGPGDIFFGHAPFGSNGTSPASAYTYTAGRDSRFDFNQFSSSFPELENYGGFVNFTHKIFGDQMVLFGDLLYQNSTTHNELAPSATGSFNTAGQTILSIPPRTQGPELGVDEGAPSRESVGQPPDSFNPFNPFQQVISGGSRARLLEFGNRLFDFENDAFVSTIGLRGDKLFDGTWGYDGGFRYSKVKVTEIDSLVSTSRFNRILNQADPIFQPGGVLAGQVAFNPFSDANSGTIASNAATTSFATVHPKVVSVGELATLDLNIYTTSLFKLPAGGVGFAFGGQFRREQFEQNLDQLNIDGDTIGSSPASDAKAGRKDYAFYAEASIPIFSPTFSFPGFYSLELTAAGRYEAFENNDTNVAVPKFGIRWQPIDESLTIRATIGKGFREPSLFELFGSPTSGLTGSQDPLPTSLGGPDTPVTVDNGSGKQVPNPDRFESETPVVVLSSPLLEPEDSVSFSGGFVFTPKFVNGLTLSIDVYDIERTGTVVAAQTKDVLARELGGLSGTGPGLRPGEAVERDSAGIISRIFTPFVNSGSLKSRGVDFGVQYVYPSAFGTFTTLTNATYLDSLQFSNGVGIPESEQRSGVTDPFGADDGFPKWKGISRLDWAWNGFDLIGTVNYTDGFHDRKPNSSIHYVKQIWTVDGQASYDFTYVPAIENAPVAGYSKDAKDMSMGKDGKPTESAASQTSSSGLPVWQRVLNGTTITLGCTNIFGQDPPKAYGFGGNSTGYPGFLYDATGRFVYVQLTKKF